MDATSGFTLLEILLAIALIALIVGIGAPIYQKVQVANDVDVALSSFREAARRAENAAQGMDSDTTWGIKVTTGTITLFQGASYATRVSSSDEFFNISPAVAVTGTTEIVFSKLTGFPLATGTTTFIAPSNATKTISINEKGVLDY